MSDSISGILETIYTRRSIRKYKPELVTEEKIEVILKAGMYAPSAGNQQPWHFVVIKDRELLDTIPGFHPHAQMLRTANCAILVCADIKSEKHKGMWIQDCSACTQNILLAAHSFGIGSVWLGIYPREERMSGIIQLLNLPEHIVPFSLISLGYPAENPVQPDRYDVSRIHNNKW